MGFQRDFRSRDDFRSAAGQNGVNERSDEIVVAAAVMVGANLLITPLFMGVTMDDVLGIMLPFILPFNLIKLGVNGALACVVYRAFRAPVARLL